MDKNYYVVSVKHDANLFILTSFLERNISVDYANVIFQLIYLNDDEKEKKNLYVSKSSELGQIFLELIKKGIFVDRTDYLSRDMLLEAIAVESRKEKCDSEFLNFCFSVMVTQQYGSLESLSSFYPKEFLEKVWRQGNSNFIEIASGYLYENGYWYIFNVVTKECVLLESDEIKKRERKFFF